MDTKTRILEAGLKAWRKDPQSVTASNVARMVGCTHPNVLYHFPNSSLKDAVAALAVERGDRKIVPQLIVAGHKAVARLSAAERADYLLGL